MGQADDLSRLTELCKANGLLLIEDAAHSIGTVYDGRMVGSIADLTTFSFHPVKTVTAGEGGAVMTNSLQLHEKIAMYRAHGITRDRNRYLCGDMGGWYYEQQLLGFNYRITDIQAALCASQLNKLEMFSKRKRDRFPLQQGVQKYRCNYPPRRSTSVGHHTASLCYMVKSRPAEGRQKNNI